MADDRIRVFREEIITEFFHNTCQFRRWMSFDDVIGVLSRSAVAATAVDDHERFAIPLLTGSTAEFYIEPALSCVGDVDIMYHRSNHLAIPAGYTPPTQLPGEFDSRVLVCEIVNSEFPGYVYLVSSYLLTECVDDDEYKAMLCERVIVTYNPNHDNDPVDGVTELTVHGPALFCEYPSVTWTLSAKADFVQSHRSSDIVFCVRCLIWPPQAADWPTRPKNYDWPDSATVDRVVSQGCDVVRVAHHLCRQDEWESKRQLRLSFSRAEIVLLNSWMPVQQIVYHMLRYFMKNEILTDSANDTGGGTLSNYHIKTLMLWACELKSTSWWTDDLNLVRICVELLHTLAVWLTDARCQHYFINDCNLFDRLKNSRYIQLTVNRLTSITRAWFCEWYTDNYIHKCVLQLCPSSVLRRVPHSSTLHAVFYLQNVVSAVVELRRVLSSVMTSWDLLQAQLFIMQFVSRESLTLRSCLCLMNQLAKTDRVVRLYFGAVVFLHVAHKTNQYPLTDEMLDVLAATCLQSNDVRRFLNAQHSSEFSLSQAAMLMKVVANSSRSTMQLIEIELAKAYLHRALRCKDSDSNSINCLANVYLAVLYHTTGQYQTAIDHCALVTRSLDHSQCSSHVVQGEFFPSIGDQIDIILGLAVFYQYIRAAALNEEQGRRHVSVFTTELFAYYLLVKFLSVTECHQLSQTSLADEIQRYRNCLCNSPEVFVTDVMAFNLANRTGYPTNDDRLLMVDRGDAKSLILHQLDTSKLVELLQQSAVEHLTTCRDELQASNSDSYANVVPPDFKALYAYKCGQYQACLQLSMYSVHKMIVDVDHTALLPIFFFPELIQLLDDDIASLIGLVTLAKRRYNNDNTDSRRVTISWLSLSLYLMTQCQIKLRHPVTSLITTLDYVHIARDKIRGDTEATYDQFVLKFVEQKILKCL